LFAIAFPWQEIKKKQNDIIDSVDIDNDADVFGPL